MKATTLRLSEETLQALESEANDRGVSRSEYIREVIEHRGEYDRIHGEYGGEYGEYDELVDRIEDLERENQRLRNEKRTLIADREERKELVRYVEEQRDVERYRDRRQRKIDQAGALTRAKWWLTGVPMDDDGDSD